MPPETERSRLNQLTTYVHLEIYQLAVLSVCALALALATRQLEGRLSSIRAADERWWFARGAAEMSAGRPDRAIDAYQRAIESNRSELRYALALGEALTAAGDIEGARTLLLSWRASAPENAALNLQLARLAAARHDVTEAVRFYNYVLYAPVADLSSDPARPMLRLELVRFLIANGEASRARSELAVVAERPLDIATRQDIATLFVDAGDPRAALNQYRIILDTDRVNPIASRGAAAAYFALGDYAEARRAFRAAGPLEGADLRRSEVANLVLDLDPLAPRLSAAARARRLGETSTYLLDRLSGCGAEASPWMDRLRVVARAVQVRANDADALSRAVEEADASVRWMTANCPQPDPRDEALALIAARHEVP